MNLFDVLHADCVEAGATAASKEEALAVVTSVAKRHPALQRLDKAVIRAALQERERMGSTGFGQGIAIPHCRLDGIGEFVVGIVTIPGGVEFEALDQEPVKLLVFIIAPARESNEHIRLLSAISQALRVPGAVEEMLRAASATAVRESFLRHGRDETESKEHDGKNLFHVFVQNEQIFRDILEVFAAMESCSLLVLEAEQGATYLARTPLFADFFADQRRGFNRLIVAAVEKRFTNETIRQIEQYAGPLRESREVLLTVQPVFFIAGRLQA